LPQQRRLGGRTRGRRAGEHEPTVTHEQIELEDEMLRAWEDYLTKRNAYLAATNTPEPA
jgi:hypothetical protein